MRRVTLSDRRAIYVDRELHSIIKREAAAADMPAGDLLRSRFGLEPLRRYGAKGRTASQESRRMAWQSILDNPSLVYMVPANDSKETARAIRSFEYYTERKGWPLSIRESVSIGGRLYHAIHATAADIGGELLLTGTVSPYSHALIRQSKADEEERCERGYG